MLSVSTPDFSEGMQVGHLCYEAVYEGTLVPDTEVVGLLKDSFSPRQRARDARGVEGMPSTDAYYAGFVTGCLKDLLTAPRDQDVHISCSHDLVETLVTEFEHQLADTPDADVYDYGWSSRFHQGFVMVSWKGRVPADFLARLDADQRLEGHSVYDLTEHEPLCIVPARVQLSVGEDSVQ